MESTQHPIFTIGHSNHSMGAFISLLHEHGIHEVVDVRSSPYSRYTPHFNFDMISGALEQKGISYSFRGGELGGRPADQSCYDSDGRVLYDRIADTDPFDGSIGSLVRSADERRIVLMCAEKQPLDCHRTLLIAPALAERRVTVEHILADGSLESHGDAMNRLMDSFRLPRHGDLFRSRNEVVADALSRQAKKVAHVGAIPATAGQRGGVEH